MSQLLPKTEQQKPLNAEEAESTVRNLALRRLSRSAVTEFQLREYLARKNADPQIVDSVIQRFIAAKLINDAEYAEMWVRSRRNMRGAGPTTMRRELKQRGVDEAIIAAAVEARDGDDYELARSLAERKLNGLRGLTADAQFRRLMSFLVRRGHTASVAISVTRDVLRDVAVVEDF